jgi:hypothetical protein
MLLHSHRSRRVGMGVAPLVQTEPVRQDNHHRAQAAPLCVQMVAPRVRLQQKVDQEQEEGQEE